MYSEETILQNKQPYPSGEGGSHDSLVLLGVMWIPMTCLKGSQT